MIISYLKTPLHFGRKMQYKIVLHVEERLNVFIDVM